MPQSTLKRLAARQAIIDQVQQSIVDAAFLDVEAQDLDPDAPLFGTGIGLDSIDAVELLVTLEGNFGLKLQEDRVLAVPHLRTINTIVDLIVCQQEAA